MTEKRTTPKYNFSKSDLDIVVTKSVVVGHVTEDDGSELSPVEAAMALIGRDIDRMYAASDVNNRITSNIDTYEFNVAGDRFVIEVNAQAVS